MNGSWLTYGKSNWRGPRFKNFNESARARMHPYCFWRDMLLFHSRQRKRMHGIRPNPRPEGRGEGDYECDELSTLSLRISRPFKRRRKGRGGELEAPRNKWKVISMNNAGRPARSLLSLSISPSSLRPAATTNGNCRISARYPKSKRICRGERHGRNST